MLRVLLLGAIVQFTATLGLLIINLTKIRKLSRAAAGKDRQAASSVSPRVSFVVPARDEERGIAAGVGSLLAQEYPDFEVIVVNDRSTDRTGAILADLGSDARLRVIEGSEPPEGWLGKPHALALGSRAASGEVLLFVDADVRYHPRVLAEAIALFEKEEIALLAFLPRLEAAGFWEQVLMPFVPGSVLGGLGFLADRDRPRWAAMGGGAGNMIRRSVYDAVGGHEAVRSSVVDDVRLAMNAKRAGFQTRIVRAEDRIAVRMYRGFAEVFDGFTKNLAYCFGGPLGVLLLALTGLFLLFSVLPLAVLLLAALGAEFPERTLALALLGFGLAVGARVLLAWELEEPVWPALTHPIMAAVWAGITCRSLYWRFVKKKLFWRGRQYEAAQARF